MKPLQKQIAAALLSLTSTVAFTQSQKSGPWEMQNSLTTAGLRGIHSVGGGVAWASGADGTVLRTEDSGYMWQTCEMPPGAEKLDFRGIWAWDADNAVVLSSGPGDQSRIYKTTDGCSHWTLTATNPDKDGFWDAIQFWDKNHGLILGDPIEDWRASKDRWVPKGRHFVILQTNDNGKSWHWKYPGRGEIPRAGAKGSGAFAASNSALVINDRWAWFAIGGKSGSFTYTGIQIPGDVLNDTGTFDLEGFAWMKPVVVPVATGGDATGVFSIAFRPTPTTAYSEESGLQLPARGMAVGGDYTKPDESTGTAAWTADGGKTWTAATKPPHGYRSSVAWDEDAKAWIAAGTNGSDISYDDGKTWQPLDNGDWNAISLPWIVGPKGRIAKLGALPPRK